MQAPGWTVAISPLALSVLASDTDSSAGAQPSIEDEERGSHISTLPLDTSNKDIVWMIAGGKGDWEKIPALHGGCWDEKKLLKEEKKRKRKNLLLYFIHSTLTLDCSFAACQNQLCQKNECDDKIKKLSALIHHCISRWNAFGHIHGIILNSPNFKGLLNAVSYWYAYFICICLHFA